MNPALVVMLVRGIIRVGSVAASAYEQYVRDKPALLPLVDMVDPTAETTVKQLMNNAPDFAARVEEDPHLAAFWPLSDVQAARRDEAVAELYAAVVAFRIQQDNDLERSEAGRRLPQGDVDAAIGAMFVVQWAKGTGPLGPFARIILTLADVALEYVGANPQVLGIGGNGEKLIGALAGNLAAIIPDSGATGAYGPKSRFGERLAAQFLRAGLQAASENPALIFEEDHLASLVENTLPPIIEALPPEIADQVKWEEVSDTLAGPAASAAIAVIAENQVKFLGGAFAPNKAIGGLTKAMLETASDRGLKEQFTKDGMIALYRSLVKLAADRPELFLGESGNDAERVGLAVFKNFMETLQSAPVPFDKDLGAHLAAATLEALNENKGLFLNESHAWENVASQALGQVISGFQAAFQEGSGQPIKSMLSGDQLVEFARIVLSQAARSPHMITGSGANDALRGIVAAVGRAMAKDDNLLLSSDEWLQIAAVAAEEAARSPGRIFGIDTASEEGQVAERLISVALKAAALDFEKAKDGVMFGATLKEVIAFLLRTASDNAQKMTDNALAPAAAGQPETSKLESLMVGLNDAVRQHRNKYGHREWLRLLKILVFHLRDEGIVPRLDDAALEKILETGKV